MLKIQEFIKEHEDWETLLAQAPYNLKIKRDDNYILFKYDQVNSDFNEPIVCEARGLILEDKTFNVVRLAFYKFFNQGESHAAEIDWDTSCGSEKIDGSLMSVWYHGGKWHLSTSGTINAFNAKVNVLDDDGNQLKDIDISFGEIFEKVMPLDAFDKYRMPQHLCYTFELVSPQSRVIIKYDEPGLYILSIRDMNTLKEYKNPETFFCTEMKTEYGLNIPKKYLMHSLEDYQKIVNDMGDDHEGLVVCDDKFGRIKIKTAEYLVRHYYKCGGINLNRLATVVAQNEDSEFLAYFPEHKEKVDKLHKYVEKLKEFADTCDGNLAVFDVDLFGIMNNIIDPKERKKQFASWVMQHFGNDPYKKGLLFKGYDKKAAETVKGWTQSKWVDFLKYAVEHPEEWGK